MHATSQFARHLSSREQISTTEDLPRNPQASTVTSLKRAFKKYESYSRRQNPGVHPVSFCSASRFFLPYFHLFGFLRLIAVRKRRWQRYLYCTLSSNFPYATLFFHLYSVFSFSKHPLFDKTKKTQKQKNKKKRQETDCVCICNSIPPPPPRKTETKAPQRTGERVAERTALAGRRRPPGIFIIFFVPWCMYATGCCVRVK